MGSGRLFHGSFQPHLEDTFCSVIAELRARDRFESIYALVPTHLLGRHLMRTVARRHGLCFNVRFHTFPELAEIFGIAPLALSGRIPLPPLTDFLIARKALRAAVVDGSYLGPIRDFPGTPRVLLETLADVKRAGLTPQQIEEFARTRSSAHSARKLGELAALYREVERLKTEAGYFDESERLDLAAGAAVTHELLDRALAVCVYGFAELNRVEQRFFEACISGRAGYAFVPDDVAAGRTRRLVDWLTGRGFVREGIAPGGEAGIARAEEAEESAAASPRAIARFLFQRTRPDHPLPASVDIISAPSPAHEVSEIARRILEFSAQPDSRFHDVAVLLRHPRDYERTIRDVFAAAGIPWVMLDGTALADTLAGRLLRLLVRIRKEDYPRPEVMEFLGLAPLRPALLKDCPTASPPDWDRYSREAGIVGGREQWRARLPDMRRRLQWRLERIKKEDPHAPDATLVPLLERDIASMSALERVTNTLFKRLAAIPGRDRVGDLLGSLLRALMAVTRLPDEDRLVVKHLAALADDDTADEIVTFETFAGLVEDLLADRLPPADVYRAGKVVVGSLSVAAGLPFRLVLIPGMVESAFPPRPRQDAFVLDAERLALNALHRTALPVREEQAADEQFAFRRALAAAADAAVLTYPRLDGATGQVRVPSHYLLAVADILTGSFVQYADLESLPTARRIPAGRLDSGATPPLNAAEWDVGVAVRALRDDDAESIARVPGFPAVVRGTNAEAGRWTGRAFTEYDGVLGVAVNAPQTLASTHLETYATCPFRFLGERVLGLHELEEPEAVETLTPLDRGAILHDILERFMRGLVEDGLVPLDRTRLDEYRRRLRAAAEAEFRAFERSGAVGYPFMWTVEQRRILTDLEAFVQQEINDDSGYEPRYFEARFGPAREWASSPAGSSPRTLDIDVDGVPLHFTGYVDRIDVHRSGQAARVLDYKSGQIRGVKDDLFQGGKTLQLPVYLLAADQMLRDQGIDAQTQEAHYYYVTSKGNFRRVRFTREALHRRMGDFAQILRTMTEEMASGLFPQRPGKGGEHCLYCPFVPVCGHGRVRLVERKQEDQTIASLATMWEIE